VLFVGIGGIEVIMIKEQLLLTVYRLPRDIDSRATITIGSESFEVEATDLESIETMGRGAYGVVERMRHRPSDTVMAVKVP